jgi:hypothetical protein
VEAGNSPTHREEKEEARKLRQKDADNIVIRLNLNGEYTAILGN